MNKPRLKSAVSLVPAVVLACSDDGPPVEPLVQPESQWVEVAPLPIPLYYFGAAAYRGMIYVAGGKTLGDARSQSAYRYDPLADRWEQIAGLPQVLFELSLVVASDTLFAVAGKSSDFGLPKRLLWAYLPAQRVWQERPYRPDFRGGHTAVGIAGQIIVIGGGVSEESIHGPRVPGDSVLAYDVATSTWEYRDPMPTPRSGAKAVVADNLVYVFGGSLADSETFGMVKMVEAYDPQTDTWTTLARDPLPTLGPAVASLRNEFHLVGGVTPPPPPLATPSHRVLDLEGLSWTFLPAVGPPLVQAEVVALDGDLYLLGGRFRGYEFGGPQPITDRVAVYRPSS